MNLKKVKRLQRQSGDEEILGMRKGDIVTISKTISGITTTILSYEPDVKLTGNVSLAFQVTEIED